MGKGLVNQLSRIKGLTSAVVIDEKPEKAMDALLSSGVRKSDITTSDNIKIIENSIKNGMYVVCLLYTSLKKIRDLIFERFKEEINLKNIIILGPNPDAIKWVNMVYRYNLTIKVLKDEDVFRQFLMELIFNKKYSFNTEKNGKLILTID